MKSGFKETLDKVLRKYGLRTDGCIGAIWSSSEQSFYILRAMGYRVEMGINKPDYDYVLLSKKKSNVINLLKALTVVKVGCIIIFRADGIGIHLLTALAKATNTSLSFYEYDDTKILGVLFKRKELVNEVNS